MSWVFLFTDDKIMMHKIYQSSFAIHLIPECQT